jgi:hypothetical protein
MHSTPQRRTSQRIYIPEEQAVMQELGMRSLTNITSRRKGTSTRWRVQFFRTAALGGHHIWQVRGYAVYAHAVAVVWGCVLRDLGITRVEADSTGKVGADRAGLIEDAGALLGLGLRVQVLVYCWCPVWGG